MPPNKQYILLIWVNNRTLRADPLPQSSFCPMNMSCSWQSNPACMSGRGRRPRDQLHNASRSTISIISGGIINAFCYFSSNIRGETGSVGCILGIKYAHVKTPKPPGSKSLERKNEYAMPCRLTPKTRCNGLLAPDKALAVQMKQPSLAKRCTARFLSWHSRRIAAVQQLLHGH